MYAYFLIRLECFASHPGWVSDVDFEGNCNLTYTAAEAKRFETFYEASRFAALIDHPVVMVSGVIENE